MTFGAHVAAAQAWWMASLSPEQKKKCEEVLANLILEESAEVQLARSLARELRLNEKMEEKLVKMALDLAKGEP